MPAAPPEALDGCLEAPAAVRHIPDLGGRERVGSLTS